MRNERRKTGFTLLELLASVTLMVVLGTMLFQIFNQASNVMRVGTGRQEIFQYARIMLTMMEREVKGGISSRDNADPSVGARPFRVYHSAGALTSFSNFYGGMPTRPGADALSLTAGIIGRDTVKGSMSFGQIGNAAHIAYWLNPNDCATREPWVLNRFESYDVATSTGGKAWDSAVNVLEFQIECLDQYASPPTFSRRDWDATGTASTGGRMGLPRAIAVTVKLTDSNHIKLYELVGSEAKFKAGFSAEDDPLAQEFRQTISLQEGQ